MINRARQPELISVKLEINLGNPAKFIIINYNYNLV